MDEHLEAQLRAANWCPDGTDFRDLTIQCEAAQALLRLTRQFQYESRVDLRDQMPPVFETLPISGAAAHACCTLIEYFRRRCEGETGRLSRAFIHDVTLLRECKPMQGDVSLRSIFKSMRRVGVPPAGLVRHLQSLGKRSIDSPLCYQYANTYAELQYFRLNVRNSAGLTDQIKALLRAGIPVAFGVAIPTSASGDARIDVRPQFDRVAGHTAGVVAGYDDNYRVSDRGAFLVHCLSASDWGEGGYGWLSYRLVKHEMVTDLWVAIQTTWLNRLSQEQETHLVDRR